MRATSRTRSAPRRRTRAALPPSLRPVGRGARARRLPTAQANANASIEEARLPLEAPREDDAVAGASTMPPVPGSSRTRGGTDVDDERYLHPPGLASAPASGSGSGLTEAERRAWEAEREKQRERQREREKEQERERVKERRWDDVGMSFGKKKDKDKDKGKEEKEKEGERTRDKGKEKEKGKERGRACEREKKQGQSQGRPREEVDADERERENEKQREKEREREQERERARDRQCQRGSEREWERDKQKSRQNKRTCIPSSREEAEATGMKIVRAKFKSMRPWERDELELKEKAERAKILKCMSTGPSLAGEPSPPPPPVVNELDPHSLRRVDFEESGLNLPRGQPVNPPPRKASLPTLVGLGKLCTAPSIFMSAPATSSVAIHSGATAAAASSSTTQRRQGRKRLRRANRRGGAETRGEGEEKEGERDEGAREGAGEGEESVGENEEEGGDGGGLLGWQWVELEVGEVVGRGDEGRQGEGAEGARGVVGCSAGVCCCICTVGVHGFTKNGTFTNLTLPPITDTAAADEQDHEKMERGKRAPASDRKHEERRGLESETKSKMDREEGATGSGRERGGGGSSRRSIDATSGKERGRGGKVNVANGSYLTWAMTTHPTDLPSIFFAASNLNVRALFKLEFVGCLFEFESASAYAWLRRGQRGLRKLVSQQLAAGKQNLRSQTMGRGEEEKDGFESRYEWNLEDGGVGEEAEGAGADGKGEVAGEDWRMSQVSYVSTIDAVRTNAAASTRSFNETLEPSLSLSSTPLDVSEEWVNARETPPFADHKHKRDHDSNHYTGVRMRRSCWCRAWVWVWSCYWRMGTAMRGKGARRSGRLG
ncbi:hypothetical protein GALMADRAFT_216856 [Galerina marginata CBS 339.88]|uniref:Uncharacterized protein n=1 Tax=Galerina marginata (strain CBS 339.88) TaxID=685588 RepID=A0A067S9K3_GALM3|nr:hypothetical protein GALMADRAFT_216856 [Galerina marginata CBS 339.88]